MAEETDDRDLDEEAYEEEPIIPEDDFREAIAFCRQDPQLNRYFELAPPGAKLFIGLGFYSTHFGDKVDPHQYAECQAEIEPALTPNDLKYLIRFERDKSTKQYLRDLLVQREAEASAAEETPAEKQAEGETEAPALSPREAWEAGVEKAEAFIRNSVEYDEEDPVCLDNLGEFLYRVREDKEAAKEWFDKAIAIKENQIDTLYFLSRYDLDAGDREAAVDKLEKAAGGRFSPLNYCSREMVCQEIEQLKGAL